MGYHCKFRKHTSVIELFLGDFVRVRIESVTEGGVDDRFGNRKGEIVSKSRGSHLVVLANESLAQRQGQLGGVAAVL
jgi:hypothetical protein